MVVKISHTLFRIAAALVACAIIAIAAFGARLAVGPIQLTWLAPYLERAIAPADQGIKVEIRNAAVRLGQHRIIELVGAGVQVRGPADQVLIDLPEIELGISLRALLWHGMLAPASLEAKAPLLILTRNEAGSIGLSGAPSETEPAAPRGQIDVNAVLGPLLSGDPSQPLSYLEQADISGGQLVLKDQITDHTLMAHAATLTVGRSQDGVTADLSFKLDQPGAPADIQTTLTRDTTTGRVSFAVNFAGLSPAKLAKFDPSVSLKGVDLALAGRLTGDIDREHGLSPIGFEVRAKKGVIDRPDWLDGRLPIDSVTVKGRLAANFSGAEVTEARIAAKGAVVEAKAQIVWADHQITLRANLTAENVAVADLGLFWPPAVAQDARHWVVANITDGVVPSAEVAITLKPGDLERYPFPEAGLRGRFAFHGITVHYADTMPPVTGIDGSATFTARRMDVVLTGGRVGGNQLSNGSVVITGMGLKGRDTTQLVLKAAIDSALEQALALLDHPPLDVAGELGVTPSAASGQVRTNLTLAMPLHKDLDVSELNVRATAELHDAGIRGLPGNLDLSAGDFTLKVDNHGADLTGKAAINQIPLAIEWHENFADDASVKRRYHVEGTVDVQGLRRLGLDMPIPATGSTRVDATMVETANARKAKLALDLEPLAIDVPALGWQKPEGQAGHLTASILMPAGGPLQVQAFEIASTGLDVAGSLALSLAPVQIEQLALSRFRAGRNEGTLDLHHRAGQGYQIAVRAQSLDLAPFVSGQVPVDHGEAGAPTPLKLTLVADHVLFDERGLSNVDLDLVRDAQGWRSGTLHGRLPKGGKVEMSLTPGTGQRLLKVTSDDAGDLLQTLDQTNRIGGGELELRARIRRQVPALDAEGKLRIKDFTLLDAPLLARLLTVASLTGIGNLLGGKGIHFDRLELPFTLRPGVIVLDKGRMSGSQIGFTVRGRVDLDHDRLDLSGTIVPIYGLNWALAKVPLVGQLLAGREGEGAFAVTYSVKGPPSDPQISVNPLSVLAPGFIRDLFSDLTKGSTDPVPAIAPK